MTQGYDTALDLDDALAAILADIEPIAGSSLVPLAQAVAGYAARAVNAPMNLPPFAASAMDGYALRSSDLRGGPPYELVLDGTSAAGHPHTSPTRPGGCVRIFTGAAVPDDLDTVVIQENCTAAGARVTVHTTVEDGANVRPPGHDVQAGNRLIEAGARISEFDAGWLAASGIDQVAVCPQPTVGVFSTGDELLDAGSLPGPGQIFDANRLTLALLLRGLPVQIRDYGIIADEAPSIRRVLTQADRECDMVLTSGGVSVGDADWVKAVVGELGALRLWKLNLKPGKPLAYGRLPQSAFFGLPGNPVSAIVTALMLVRPALERLCGGTPSQPLTVPASLRGELRHQPGREEFQRGTLTLEDGTLHVAVTGDQSSNRLASFARANCLIRIPKESGDMAPGATVLTLPFRGLF